MKCIYVEFFGLMDDILSFFNSSKQRIAVKIEKECQKIFDRSCLYDEGISKLSEEERMDEKIKVKIYKFGSVL